MLKASVPIISKDIKVDVSPDKLAHDSDILRDFIRWVYAVCGQYKNKSPIGSVDYIEITTPPQSDKTVIYLSSQKYYTVIAVELFDNFDMTMPGEYLTHMKAFQMEEFEQFLKNQGDRLFVLGVRDNEKIARVKFPLFKDDFGNITKYWKNPINHT